MCYSFIVMGTRAGVPAGALWQKPMVLQRPTIFYGEMMGKARGQEKNKVRVNRVK